MKAGLVAFTLILAACSVGLAQDEKAIDPQAVSVFYCLDASGGRTELERQTALPHPKGFKTLYVISGEKSPVRLSANDQLQFVVRVTENFDTAAATLQLYRFEVQHGSRQLLLKNSDIRKNKATLGLNASRYASSSLKVVPAEKLAPGEYCLSRTTTAQGFCFGVD